MKQLTLRPYQVDALRFICDRADDICIEQPTGAGKTLLIRTAVAKLFKKGITHVVIAAPQRHIEAGFVDSNAAIVQAGHEKILLPAYLIRTVRRQQRGRSILDYLDTPTPGFAVACTHQTLSSLNLDRFRSYLRGYLLCLDEAHHVAAPELGAFIDAWRKRGGRLLFTTATPFRSDWRPVILENMLPYRRCLAEHMQDGDGAFAPRRLANEMVVVNIQEPITAAQFTGEEAPPLRKQGLLVRQMVKKWQEDGRPKTIVRVPPLAGGSGTLVSKLIKAFRKAGARVFNATGADKGRQRAFLQFLAKERNAPYEKTADVVIGIQRVVEGTDWPVCACVFMVGLPGSLQAVVQALGRATRKKPDEYPEPFRNLAKIVFFVLSDHGQNLEQLPFEHSRHALLLSAFLADSQVGREWAVDRMIQLGLVSELADQPLPVNTRRDRGSGRPAKNGQPSPAMNIPAPYRAAAQLAAAQVLEDAQKKGKDLAAQDLGFALSKHPLVQQIPEEDRPEVIAKLVVELLIEQDGLQEPVAASLLKNARQASTASQDDHPVGRNGTTTHHQGPAHDGTTHNGDGHNDDGHNGLGFRFMETVLRNVVQEFRNQTIARSDVLDALRNQLHQLTGGDMATFAERLKQALHQPIPLTDVHAAILEFHGQTGNWPSTVSGHCQQLELDFRQLDNYLRNGIRGLGPDSSLYKEIKAVAAANQLIAPDRDYDTTPLSEADVQEAIGKHFDTHDDAPKVGPTPSLLGMNWDILDRYLRKGGRGLGPGSSLSQQVTIFRRSRGLAAKESPGRLTLADVQQAVRAYAAAQSERPSRQTPGKVPGIGISWGALENLLKRGGRGLGQKMTLAQLVTKTLGPIPSAADNHEVKAEAQQAIRAYHEQTAEAPTRETSGTVPLMGIGWGTLNNQLRRIGSSLAEEVRAVLGQLPGPNQLTIEMVRKAIRQFWKTHRVFPMRNTSDPVPDLGGSWGTLNNNLIHGGRGLPGGSSLAAEVRAVAATLEVKVRFHR